MEKLPLMFPIDFPKQGDPNLAQAGFRRWAMDAEFRNQ